MPRISKNANRLHNHPFDGELHCAFVAEIVLHRVAEAGLYVGDFFDISGRCNRPTVDKFIGTGES